MQIECSLIIENHIFVDSIHLTSSFLVIDHFLQIPIFNSRSFKIKVCKMVIIIIAQN
jgi:hypothetical protein